MTTTPSIDLHWQSGSRLVTWTYDGNEIQKTFPVAPSGVTAWPSPPSVIVIEARQQGHSRVDNAVVFDPDGTERLRLRPPRIHRERHWDIGFYTAYPDSDGLVVVFSTRAGDFWGRPNLHTGELSQLTEWR